MGFHYIFQALRCSRIRFTLLFGGCFLVICPIAQAFPPTKFEIEAYIRSKQAKALSIIPDLTSRALQGEFDKPRELPFQGGNSLDGVVEQLADDLVTQAEDFYGGGADWQVVGICYKCDYPYDCEFDLYQAYEYPYEMVEIAGMYQGQYTADEIMDLLYDVTEGYRYEETQDMYASEANRVQRLGKKKFHTPFDSGDVEDPELEFLEDVDEERRARWDILGTSGGMQRQYSFFNPLTHDAGIPEAYDDNCHDTPGTMLASRSENPIHALPTHLSQFSDLLFAQRMAFMQFKPELCVGHNIFSMVTQPSPFKNIALPLRMRNHCMERLGALYPIVTQMHSIRSFRTGAPTSILRGSKYFRYWDTSSKIDYAFYENNTHDDAQIDKLLWHFPEPWVTDEHKLVQDDTDFRNGISNGFGGSGGSYKPGVYDTYDDPYRAVATIQKEIRCCPEDYDILSGPDPELKGLQDFPEDSV